MYNDIPLEVGTSTSLVTLPGASRFPLSKDLWGAAGAADTEVVIIDGADVASIVANS